MIKQPYKGMTNYKRHNSDKKKAEASYGIIYRGDDENVESVATKHDRHM